MSTAHSINFNLHTHRRIQYNFSSERFLVELSKPALSTANVCELLRAVLLTPASALQIVMRMLLDRAASTRSRLKARINQEASP
jgi:hypothetical protein